MEVTDIELIALSRYFLCICCDAANEAKLRSCIEDLRGWPSEQCK
jgi:hypothetical protein